MWPRRLQLLFVVLVLALSLVVVSAYHSRMASYTRPLSIQIESRLEPAIERFLRRHRVPGLAVGLIRNGEVVYMNGFGVVDLESRRPVTSETLFHVASISKSFVSAAILQLNEQGRLSLDGRVTDYLPYFRLADDCDSEITIEQLLSHTSGIPDYDKRSVNANDYARPAFDDGALERYVRRLGELRLASAPGTSFHYSNSGFNILGDVIAKVSGRSFEEQMRIELLEPLRMTSSSLLLSAVDTTRLAAPYRLLDGTLIRSPTYPYHRAHGPNGMLHTCVQELCNWIEMLLRRGEFEGRQVLQPASCEEMWSPRQQIGRTEHVALGWFRMELEGIQLVSHSGADLGYRAGIALAPDLGLGWVLLANRSDAPIQQLSPQILRMLARAEGP